MSWGYYFNLEKLTLSIAQEHIQCMTNNNYYDDIFLDSDILINNLKNGFVVITQLSSYFESYINTILGSCANYDGTTLLKCSIDEKLEIIFLRYGKELQKIRGQHPWEIHKKVTSVRNEMIHYKKPFIGHGTGIPKFKLGTQEVAQFFTKDTMTDAFNQYQNLAKLIANELGLTIFENIDIFECDGRDGLVNYVYNSLETEIDESRFEDNN